MAPDVCRVPALQLRDLLLYCINCGLPAPEGDSYCFACGRRLSAPPVDLVEEPPVQAQINDPMDGHVPWRGGQVALGMLLILLAIFPVVGISIGIGKLAGEFAALVKTGSLVLRTNFFGPSHSPGRSSLSDWLIGSLTSRQPVTLFKDVLFSPLHMSTLCERIVDALARRLAGVFNLGCREGVSKMEFGLLVAEHLGLRTDTVTVGNSAALPRRAPRPLDLRMNVGRMEKAMRITMPTLREEIKKL